MKHVDSRGELERFPDHMERVAPAKTAVSESCPDLPSHN